MYSTSLTIEFIVSLLIVILCGSIVGYERQKHSKIIGVRTCILIILGSFVFTHISTFVGGDPSRIISQIVSGIGFVGAGIIFKNGLNDIRHLTTAVLVWTLAALGCLIALQVYKQALLITVLIFLILKFKIIKL